MDLEIYCVNKISNKELQELNNLFKISGPELYLIPTPLGDISKNNIKSYLQNCIKLLIKCNMLLTDFMRGSYTTNLNSCIIQSLFIQQIKSSRVLCYLISSKEKHLTGQESLCRMICEIYIKIEWLLNDNKNQKLDINNRFMQYKLYETRRLRKYLRRNDNKIYARLNRMKKYRHILHVPDQCLSKKKLRNKKLLKDDIYNINIFENQLSGTLIEGDRLHRIFPRQFPRINSMDDDKDIKLDKKLLNLKYTFNFKMRNLTRNASIKGSKTKNYRIYSELCSELHSNMISIIPKNIIYLKDKKEYISNLKDDEHYINPYIIGDLLVFLSNTFYHIYKYNDCNMFRPMKSCSLSLINKVFKDMKKFAGISKKIYEY